MLNTKAGLLRHKPRNNRFGFTLAEVLITLGVIGILVALTLPILIGNYQKKQFQAGLNKEYSVLLQALDMYKENNGANLSSKDCAFTKSSFKNYLQPYLKVLVDCGDSQADVSYLDMCVRNGAWYQKESSYLTYTGYEAAENYFDDGQLVLLDGSVLMFQNDGNGGSSYVSVDVNGFKKRPNKWGVDLFTFQLMENGKLLPMGMKETDYTYEDVFCSKNSSNNYNGISCTNRALYDPSFWK